MRIKTLLIAGALLFTVSFNIQPALGKTVLEVAAAQARAPEKFLRTELYFGMNITGGGTVSEDDWAKFLNEEVTPKFPEGFTVVEAYGQFRDKDGNIGKEKSRMLILLYPKNTKKDSHVKIEAIRAAYVKTFKQESVLRMDLSQAVNVSF